MLCVMTDQALITVEELAVWVREDIDPEDSYAEVICQASTIIVNDHAQLVGLVDSDGIATRWTPSTAPERIKIVVAQIAKRNWINGNRLTREGSIGPIGGDSYAEAMAAGMELTEVEEGIIEKVVTGEAPLDDKGKMWVIETHSGRGDRPDLYLRDDSAPFSDALPFLTPELTPYYFPVKD